MSSSIAFLGFGIMAGSLAQAFVREGIFPAERIIGTTHSLEKKAKLESEVPFKIILSNREASRLADVIVLCVRPQQAKALLQDIGPIIARDKILVSIMAGIPLAAIRSYLPKDPAIVHVHPSSLAFGSKARGISFVVPEPGTESQITEYVRRIFSSLGGVVTTTEDELDQYVILAGCAPAYLALVVYYLSQVGIRLGLSATPSVSLENLVVSGLRDTLLEDGWTPAKVIENIATPGGVTSEGLRILESAGLAQILENAGRASLGRLREFKKILD